METTIRIPAPPEAAASQQVFQIATGYIASTALYAAAKLRLPDHLADGPRGVADLARATGANEDALYRVLRLLASVGIFEETTSRHFANNAAFSKALAEGKTSFGTAKTVPAMEAVVRNTAIQGWLSVISATRSLLSA